MPHALKSTLGPWLLGATAALTLHAGAIAYVATRAGAPDLDEELGAPAIEVGFELASPDSEPTDLPPGRDAEASAASVAAAEQKPQVEDTTLPLDVATPSEDPDQIVSPQPKKEPEEKPKETATARTSASSESAASEAAAAPSMEDVNRSAIATAPVQGTGRSTSRIVTTWQRQLVAHLDRNKRYPSDMAQRSVQVELRFTLDRLGHVVAIQVARGSGEQAFDDAAIAMMRRADPVPAPPAVIADDGLTFSLPVVFRARGRT